MALKTVPILLRSRSEIIPPVTTDTAGGELAVKGADDPWNILRLAQYKREVGVTDLRGTSKASHSLMGLGKERNVVLEYIINHLPRH